MTSAFEKFNKLLIEKGNLVSEKLNDPNFLRIKSKEVNSAIKTGLDIAHSAGMDKVYTTAREVLTIIEKTKGNNLPSIIAASVLSLETITKFVEVDTVKDDPIDRIITALKLKCINGSRLVQILMSEMLWFDLNRKQVEVYEKIELSKITVGEDNYIYEKRVEYKVGGDDVDRYERKFDFYLPKDFSYEKFYKWVWEKVNNKAYLIRKKGKIELMPLVSNVEDILVDEEEVALLGQELVYAKKHRLSRSYLLMGPPGTGKTSFSHVVIERYCPRVLKVDPSVAQGMESGELEQFIESVRPDAIVFDDIDRCSQQEAFILFLLETLKKNYPEIVIFASANYWGNISEAIRRPGRFDRVIWFENPDEAFRRLYFRKALDKLSIQMDSILFDQLVEATDSFTQAYLGEVVNRLRYTGNQEATLKSTVKEFRKTLGMSEYHRIPQLLVDLPHCTTDIPESQQEFYFDVKINPVERKQKDSDSLWRYSSYYD